MTPAALGEFLIEYGQAARTVLPNGLHQRQVRAAGTPPPAQTHAFSILFPRGQVGDEFETESAAVPQGAVDRCQRCLQVPFAQE